MKQRHYRGRGFFYVPAFFSRLGLLRFGRAGTWYLFASAGVVAAAVVIVSLLTLLPNDAYEPIIHPIERVAPGEMLKRVDDQVATLLGVDKETVRNVREGLVGSGIPLAQLREISASRPANASSAAPVPSDLTPPNGATPASVEPSPTMGEPPPTTDAPPPATTEPPPAAEEPPPTTEEPAPPATDEPAPATDIPTSPPTEEPPPTTSA